MANTVRSLEHARNRLRALRAEKPATAAGQIRWAWPEIKAALDVGHSLVTVHQRLAEVGIALPYRRLSYYVNRLRREEIEQPGRFAPPDPVTAGVPIPAPPPQSLDSASTPAERTHGRDPLANLRKLASGRPGFQWDESPPDKNKLL